MEEERHNILCFRLRLDNNIAKLRLGKIILKASIPVE